MAIWIPWLADAARLTGHPVIEVKGWQTRGHGGMTAVEGVVAHHTAGPRTGEYPSLGVVRDGRAGLAGPLSQLGIGRSGTVYVIAAGVAYHAGTSSWAGYTSLNSRFIGIEAESCGTADDWTPAQRDCYPRLCAALLHYMRRGVTRLAGHKEVAPGRKIDPAYWDMSAMRAQVARMLEDPLNRIPRTTGGANDVALSNDQVAQLRRDMGYLRDQILTRLGVPDPANYPAKLEQDALSEIDPARRVDVGHVLTRLSDQLGEIKELLRNLQVPVTLSDQDVRRIADAIGTGNTTSVATAVADEIARRAQS